MPCPLPPSTQRALITVQEYCSLLIGGVYFELITHARAHTHTNTHTHTHTVEDFFIWMHPAPHLTQHMHCLFRMHGRNESKSLYCLMTLQLVTWPWNASSGWEKEGNNQDPVWFNLSDNVCADNPSSWYSTLQAICNKTQKKVRTSWNINYFWKHWNYFNYFCWNACFLAYCNGKVVWGMRWVSLIRASV